MGPGPVGFDLDMTLIDSRPAIMAAFAAMAGGAAAYVGDTPPDIAAGLSAGVRAIGVATGSFTAAELRRAGAELVLGTLEEFPAWYQGLSGR